MQDWEKENFITANAARLAKCIDHGFFTIFLAEKVQKWEDDTNYISVYIIDPSKGVWNMNGFIHEYLGTKVSTSSKHYGNLIVRGSINGFVYELLSKMQADHWQINVDLTEGSHGWDKAYRLLA